MSRDGWHAANSNSHPSAAADSGGAAFSAEDDAAAGGGYNPDYDAFLAEEEALPVSGTQQQRMSARDIVSELQLTRCLRSALLRLLCSALYRTPRRNGKTR